MPTSEPPEPSRESPARLADRQSAIRRQRFVGRARELTLFRDALGAVAPPFAVLYIHGPGGVGKTMLLRQCAHAATDLGAPVVQLDARNLDATPAGFLGALRHALSLPDDGDVFAALPSDRPSVLIIDTYEQLAPLDAWLRERFLPQLPARCTVVIAGRNPPAGPWRTDPDWRDLLFSLPLRNLGRDDARALLAMRGVSPEQHDAALSATHGHPLALVLLADVAAQTGAALPPLDRVPDVVTTLVERFLEHAPSARHRLALQACAHARVMTEPLLREALAQEDVHDLFAWLRGLSFVEQGVEGLFPHDLARDVLDNEARWRDVETYRLLHFRLRNHHIAQLRSSTGAMQLRHMNDVTYLHRNNPLLKPYFDWKELGNFFVEPALRSDAEAIADIVERFEGKPSGQLAMHWLSQQLTQWRVVRDAGGDCIGLVAHIHLDASMHDAIRQDPGAATAWDYAQRHAPLRPGEVMTFARFAADAHQYQTLTPVLNALQLFCGLEWITVPNKAWSFVALSDPDALLDMMSYYNFHRAYDADFEIDGRHYGVYAHDWRKTTVEQWLDRLFVQQVAHEMSLSDVLAEQPAPLLVLSQEDFEAAAKQALKDWTRPDLLSANPLMRSRLVREQADASPERLQRLVREACEALRGNPRDEKLYRVLLRTYLEPAPTQEAVAERLGLPFGTYRSQLINATGRVVAWLWQRELR